jgi:lipopolysaccharide/colanic/teichoic acid biosynthesis glycosyltransferase
MTSAGRAGHSGDTLKRMMDVAVAAVGLLITAPVQAVLALMVARNLGRPVLFRQQRPGRFGKPFTLLKFRTMREADPAGGLITDADRLTPFGVSLRSASLDELPTLWNVLRGDMSLVGPRPLLMQYLDRYTPEQMRRHEVRPGITGLAQVSGRNALTWEQKFAADVEYVDRRRFSVDVGILARTVGSVLRREGVSASGDATMPVFLGSAITNRPS